MKPCISEVRMSMLSNSKTTLKSYASCLLDHQIRLSGIEIHEDEEQGFWIEFPQITLPNGKTKPYFDFLDPNTKSHIDNEIFQHWDQVVLSMKS